MNNTIKNFVIFAVGAALGSAITARLIEEKYKCIAQEEIDSVREAYKATTEESEEKSNNDILWETAMELREKANASNKKPNVVAYTKMLHNNGYNFDPDIPETPTNIVYVDPQEFGEMYGYEGYELTYYSDGILADEMEDIVDDFDEAVGADFASHFGEYEEDSVCVRNDARHCYYMILRDYRTHAEVLEKLPKVR